MIKEPFGYWGAMLLAVLCAFWPASRLYAADPPVMGWSSWNTFRVNISDSLIKSQADALILSGLAASGYRYVNIDDGYFGGRDRSGQLVTHPVRFPQGLRPVVEHIHALGLKAGIYSDAGRNTCGSFWDHDSLGIGVGFYGHDAQDAAFFFDSLRFDFIKIDFCGGDAKQNFEKLDLSERDRYEAIIQAIRATGRKDVRINICRWAFPGTWACRPLCSWRISSDINPSWASIKSILAQNRYLSAYAAGGAYNDMDMLEIGRGLTAAEERTHFGMWCMQSSPLLIGCDLTQIPHESFALITNSHLIAINQDTLGLQASIVRSDCGVFLYAKDLLTHNGRLRAVAVCNTSDEVRTFSFHPSELLLGGQVSVYDVFSCQETSNGFPERQEVTLQPHDTRIFRMRGTVRLERTRYEAETAWLNRYQRLGMNPALGYAEYAEDAASSGGAKVTHLGNHPDNWLEWRDVFVKRSGTYSLRLRLAGDAGRTLFCRVNGGKGHKLRAMGTGREVEVAVRLKEGCNTVRLYNDREWMPDVDCLSVFAE